MPSLPCYTYGMDNTQITLKELATELGMDRSHLRKYVLNLGIIPHRVRTPESRNQATLAVCTEEADQIRKARADGGFADDTIRRIDPHGTGGGLLYIVQPDIEARPERVKLGHTTNFYERMAMYRTANPDTVFVDFVGCKQNWEAAWIALLTGASDCTHVAGEVYDCTDIEALIRRLHKLERMVEGAEVAS